MNKRRLEAKLREVFGDGVHPSRRPEDCLHCWHEADAMPIKFAGGPTVEDATCCECGFCVPGYLKMPVSAGVPGGRDG